MGWIKKTLGIKNVPKADFTLVTDENYNTIVTESPLPVMLFVWSNSCPHCKSMAPNVQKIANRFNHKIRSAHTNTEHAPKTLGKLNVRGVPTTLFIENGKIMEHVTGFRPENYLAELILTKFNLEPQP